jgi:hypothetical protein
MMMSGRCHSIIAASLTLRHHSSSTSSKHAHCNEADVNGKRHERQPQRSAPDFGSRFLLIRHGLHDASYFTSGATSKLWYGGGELKVHSRP